MERWSQQGFHVQHQNALLAQLYINLYRCEGQAAWTYISERWPRYKNSLLLRIQHVRIDVLQLRARSAVMAAMTRADPTPLLRNAERDARRLERERVGPAEAHAQAIRAGIAAIRGNPSEAATRLSDAAVRYENAEMRLYSASARRWLGKLLGGDEGQELVRAADTWISDQMIRDPVRIASMYIPGFSERTPTDH
jgi:hypothetical protein